ncbi:MAG: hypothetical protein R6X19_00550 [Kiritimatiellia bacterium]
MGKWVGAGLIGLALSAAMAGPPPPPPPNGGTIKPPDTLPPGKIYFEDNVVIVGPGFVKPDSNGGTVFVDLSKINADTLDPNGKNSKTFNQVVRELSQVKAQVEAEAVALPRGLLDPVSLLAVLNADDLPVGEGIFEDPAFLHEEAGSRDLSASDRTDQARSGGAAVQAAPGAPAPARAKKGGPGAPAIPSYWQLPIR